MAQRFMGACAVLAGPRLGVRAAKGDGGKRRPPGFHPHVFQRQAIPYTKDHRTEAKDKLLRQVDLARRDAAVRTNAALMGMHAAAGSATF